MAATLHSINFRVCAILSLILTLSLLFITRSHKHTTELTRARGFSHKALNIFQVISAFYSHVAWGPEKAELCKIMRTRERIKGSDEINVVAYHCGGKNKKIRKIEERKKEKGEI